MIVEPIIIAFHTFIKLFLLLLEIEAIIIIDSWDETDALFTMFQAGFIARSANFFIISTSTSCELRFQLPLLIKLTALLNLLFFYLSIIYILYSL